MLNELCHVTAGKISLRGGSSGCSFTAHKNFSDQWLSPAALLFEKRTKTGAVIERTINLWTVTDVTVRGQNHGYEMGLRQMLRWFWKQSMSWKVRLVEGWEDCAGAQFRKGLKPGGSCMHRSVCVCVGGVGDTAGLTFRHAWTEFLGTMEGHLYM